MVRQDSVIQIIIEHHTDKTDFCMKPLPSNSLQAYLGYLIKYGMYELLTS